MTKKIIKMKSR